MAKSQSYIVGSIVETPKGKVKILDYTPGKNLPDNKKLHARITIKCLGTGTVLDIQASNLRPGKFSDYRLPTVYGVGYIGSPIMIPNRGCVLRNVYDLWANMLKRAYGKYATSYKGVTVDKRWHNFTNFINTIPTVEGYYDWEDDPTNFVLDKDTKVQGNKVYSRDTCRFIPATDNIRDSLLRRWHGSSEAMTNTTD